MPLTEATKPQLIWGGQTRLPNSVTFNLSPKRKEGCPGVGEAIWRKRTMVGKAAALEGLWRQQEDHGAWRRWAGVTRDRAGKQQGRKVKKATFSLRSAPLAAVTNWIMEQHKNRHRNPSGS